VIFFETLQVGFSVDYKKNVKIKGGGGGEQSFKWRYFCASSALK